MYSKIKKIISILLITVAIVSCGKEDNGSGTEIIFDADVSSTSTEANVPVVFTDYSTGVTSRKWTFPGGSVATSTEAEVSVSFSSEGPVNCTLDVVFNDGTSDTKTIVIQVGSELYSRTIFGFEDETAATNAWKTWVSDGSQAVSFSIDNTQGANGTSSCAKITITTANVETQIFTKENEDPHNAILQSNTDYIFSFWAKSDTHTSITAAEVTNQSETQAWYNYAWYSPILEISNVWKHFTVEFNPGDISEHYAEGQANNAYVQFKFVQATTGILYIDEVSIKEGTLE